MDTIKHYKNCAKAQYITRILLVALVYIASGCDSFVEIDRPDTQLTAQTIFEDAQTADAAMADVYSNIRDKGLLTGQASGITCLLGLYTDELDYYQDGGSNDFYTNSLFATSGPVEQLWNAAFSAIYASNSVIEGVNSSSALDTATKDRLIGEALFVRALLHSYIAGLFGEIPYITTTDYRVNSTVSKLQLPEVYNSIIADLHAAAALLPESYATPERVRPNRAAAYALLSRVYLTAGDWAAAADNASAVINNADYVWENDLTKVFLKESSTTIWQLSPAGEGYNTEEGRLFIFNEGPPPTVALTPTLLAAFPEDDLRRLYWTRAVSDGTQAWVHAYKYKQRPVEGSSTEYSVVLRLAEQYLIRAEARAMQGDVIGAREDLNRIRTTAGLPETSAVEISTLMADIQQQWHLEFFCEYGHRFFDLKRSGLLNSALETTKAGWDGNDSLWPLPARELLSNPNLLPQNNGY